MSTYLKVNEQTANQKHFSSVHVPKGPVKLTKPIIFKEKPKKDDLNSWGYCDPENLVDTLAQPYRMIDEILNQHIIERVNETIYKIESLRDDPSYEGGIKELRSISTFPIEGITCLHRNIASSSRYIMTGDREGSFQLLEVENRIQIFKVNLTPNKPLIDISSCCLRYFDNEIQIVACISLKDMTVRGFLIRQNENKTYPFFEVVLQAERPVTHEQKPKAQPPKEFATAATVEPKSLNPFPKSSVISSDGTLISVTTWGGEVKVYRLPVVPVTRDQVDGAAGTNLLQNIGKGELVNSSEKRGSSSSIATGVKSPKGSRAGTTTGANSPSKFMKEEKKPPGTPHLESFKVNSLAELQVKIIKEELVTLPCETDLLMPQIENVWKLLDVKEKLVPEEKDPKKAAAAKKPQGKPQKGQPMAPVEMEGELEELAKIKPKEVKEIILDEEKEKAKEIPPDPEFQPIVFFVYEKIQVIRDLMYVGVPDEDEQGAPDARNTSGLGGSQRSIAASQRSKKADQSQQNSKATKPKFSKKPYVFEIPTMLLICYRDTKNFKLVRVQEINDDAMPVKYNTKFLFYSKFMIERSQPGYKRTEMTAEQIKKSAKKFHASSLIEKASFNNTAKFLALGGKDGSITIWDMADATIKYTLEGHENGPVRSLEFFNHEILISGGSEGMVMIHSVSENGKAVTQMKRKNFFTINSGLKHIEEANQIVGQQICANGLLACIDNHSNFRIFSISKKDKLYKLEIDSKKYQPILERPCFENYKGITDIFCINCRVKSEEEGEGREEVSKEALLIFKIA